MSLEEQFRSFSTSIYPTTEEIIENNASVLYKRKKFFLEDLRRIFKGIGYILIALAYLRDISMFRFIIRGFAQFSISNPYPVPSPNVILSDENKRAMAKFLLLGVFASNLFCFVCHLIWGAYKIAPQVLLSAEVNSSHGFLAGSSSNDYDVTQGFGSGVLNMLYGGLTVQFIGERLPYSRLELLVLDFFIFVVQITYHGLMCVVDDSRILQTMKKSNGNNDDEENYMSPAIRDDGYNGNVDLLSLDIVSNVKKVLKYEHKFQMIGINFATRRAAGDLTVEGLGNENVNNNVRPNEPVTIPGAFPDV